MAELKYFNALMSTVLGNDEERKAAKEYLATVDPEIWGEDSEQGPQDCGVFHRLTAQLWITLKCEKNHISTTRRVSSGKCRWLRL